MKYFRILMFLLLTFFVFSAKNYAITWTSRTSGTNKSLSGLVYGNYTLVAVGGHYTSAVNEMGTVLTSQDGITWTSRTTNTNNALISVAFGNNTFVAVGYNGAILTSSDGISWIRRASEALGDITDIAFGNNTFIALFGSKILISSDNGITWELITSSGFYGVKYFNNIFVGYGGSGKIMTSSDGITWTNRNSGTTDSILGVTYGNNTFVAVGGVTDNYGNVTGRILTSPDGITWTTRISGASYLPHDVTYSKNIFVTFASVKSDVEKILTSPDGITWSSTPSITADGILGLSSGIKTFIAVGANGTIIQSGPLSISPAISVSPISLDFDIVSAGSNLYKAITIQNVGYDSLVVGNIYFTGTDDSEFSIQNDNCSDKVLVPSESQTLEIIFSPSSKGPRTADLSIPTNDPDNLEATIPINGFGSIPPGSLLGNLDNTAPGSANRIDGHDLYILGTAFGSQVGDSNWSYASDLDGNSIIDGKDLVIFAPYFGINKLTGRVP